MTKDELSSMINVAKKFSEKAVETQQNAAKRTKVSIDKYGLTPEAVLPTSVVDSLYGTTTDKQNWYQQYQTNVPAGTASIGVGNGLTITRP